MDLTQVRERWVKYNLDLIEDFEKATKADPKHIEKLKYFGVDFLIDFESELDEDPENEDGGILTIDTVTAGYMDSFLGRWYIQKNEEATEDDIREYMDAFDKFYGWLKKNKLYKERAAQYTKMARRFTSGKKYLKRIREYKKILELKDDEEKYLDELREWEYEDLF